MTHTVALTGADLADINRAILSAAACYPFGSTHQRLSQLLTKCRALRSSTSTFSKAELADITLCVGYAAYSAIAGQDHERLIRLLIRLQKVEHGI